MKMSNLIETVSKKAIEPWTRSAIVEIMADSIETGLDVEVNFPNIASFRGLLLIFGHFPFFHFLGSLCAGSLPVKLFVFDRNRAINVEI
jgi:hypothetical protein